MQDEQVISGITFKDISSEEYRSYKFPDGSIVTIQNPTRLNVSRSGGHRLVDESGVSHYIPSGWNHLSWKAKEGQPSFVY